MCPRFFKDMFRVFNAAALLLLLLWCHFSSADDVVTLLKEPKPLPQFELQDQLNEPFSREDLEGKWTLMFIGFTSCPDVCPYTLAILESVRAQLGLQMMPDKLPEIVFLAVDPERDKQNLKAYLAHFHGEFVGLTGSKSEIDTLVDGLGAFYRLNKKKGVEHYDVTHSSAIMFLDPEVKVVAHLNPPFSAREVSTKLMLIMRGLDINE